MTDNDLTQLAGAPILVTGGTGFTGSHLLRKLADAGLEVRAIVRPSSNRDHIKDLKVDWIEGDVFDDEVVRPAMKGVQYCFHMAAIYRQANVTREMYHKVHLHGTQTVARAARDTPGFKRLIHVSTIGVHGHIKHPPADEQAPFDPDDDYQDTNARAENWLRDYAAKNRLAHTIIRPCAIYGPGDERLLKVFRMATRRYCPILGHRPCLYHLIHVDDLVRILLRAAVHPDAVNETFIAGNPKALPLDKMIHIIADALNNPVRIIRLPAWPFFLAALLCEGVCRPLGIDPPLYRRRVAFYTKDRSFDTNKLRAVLGYETQLTNEDGLRQTAQWYAEQGLLQKEAP